MTRVTVAPGDVHWPGKLAPDEQAGFVMTLLRLHVFRPAQEGDAPSGCASLPRRSAPGPAKSGRSRAGG